LVPPLQHEDKVSSADFDPKGERIATRTDKTVRILDARTGAPIGARLQHEDKVSSAAFDPTDRHENRQDGAHIWTRAQARRSARGWSMRTKSLPPILTPRASGSPREQTRRAHLGGASGWRRFANPYPRNTREECAGASQVPARCTATRRMAGLHGYDSQRLGHYLDLDATNHWLSLIKLIGMASKL
jgi:hypothetical protein